MKIIVQGQPPKLKVYRGECHKCGTIAEAPVEELKDVHSGDQRDGPFGFHQCPVCPNPRMVFYPK